jgi:subtilisin family serine protease
MANKRRAWSTTSRFGRSGIRAGRLLIDGLERRVLLAIDAAAAESLPSIDVLRGMDAAALESAGVVRLGPDQFARDGEWLVRGIAPHRRAGQTRAAAMRESARTSLGAELTSLTPLGGSDLFSIRTSRGLGAGERAAERTRIAAIPGVRWAEPNYIVWADAPVVPNDPQFTSLWGLNNTGQSGGKVDADVDAPEAWESFTGDGSVVVGVIDTGIDYAHPDLAANIWTNPGEIAGNAIDDDGNGFVDDVHGYDFVGANDTDPMDDHYHGTHVAGTIGAAANNSTGVAGVAWNVKLMALKFLSASGSGTTDDAIEAVNYVGLMKSRGVNVRLTNNSWGGGGFSQALLDAIRDNAAKDVLFVAAAGNYSTNTDASAYYPQSYDSPNVISVAATDRNDLLASFSNYGTTSVDLAAPGVDIVSTSPGASYRTLSGTSMATPHVSGAAAMLFMRASGLGYAAAKSALLTTVDPIASLAGKVATGGRLNLARALSSVGLIVRGVTPGAGAIVTAAPTSFSIEFAEPVNAATLDASDLTVNGIAADAVSIDSPARATFTFAASPVTAEGVQTIALAAGVVTRPGDGLGNAPFSDTFRYDASPLRIVGTSPAQGTTVDPSTLTTITLDFSEPVLVSSVSAPDLSLSHGSVDAVSVVDPDTLQFTVSGFTRDGTIVGSIAQGAILDVNGGPSMASSFSIETDFATTRIVPTSPAFVVNNQQHVITTQPGRISQADDVDDYFVAAMRFSLRKTWAVIPRSPNQLLVLEGFVSGLDTPKYAATSPAPGMGAVFTDGLFVTDRIRVRSLDGSTGDYELRQYADSTIEPESVNGVANDSIATATPIPTDIVTLYGRAAAGDVDFFQFKPESTRSLAVFGSGATISLRAFDPSGNLVARSVSMPGGAIIEELAGVGLADVWTVAVSGASGDYVLQQSPGLLRPGTGVKRTLSSQKTAFDYLRPSSLNRLYSYSAMTGMISELSPTTGAVLRSFASPVAVGAGPDFGMATTSTSVLAAGRSDLPIYELDPTTGATLRMIPKPAVTVSGLAFADGEIFLLTDSPTGTLYVLDYQTGTVKRTFTVSAVYEALTAGGGRLYGAAGSTIYTIDPQNGATTALGTVDNAGIEGLAYVNDELIVGSAASISAHHPTQLYRLRAVAGANDLEALAGDASSVGGTSYIDYEFYFGPTGGGSITVERVRPDVNVVAPANELLPTLEAYVGGTLVASNYNPLDENFVRLNNVSGFGLVRVRVGSKNGKGGLFKLSLTNTPETPITTVISTTPSANSVNVSPDSKIIIDFSRTIDLRTVAASDFLVNGIAATSVNVVDGDTLEFTPASQLRVGSNTLSLLPGSMMDALGRTVQSFGTTVVLGSGPRIVNSSVQEGEQFATGSRTFSFVFSEAMDPVSFELNAFSLVGAVSGARSASSYTYTAATKTASVTYTSLPEDNWTLRLAPRSGFFRSVAGVELDGETPAWPIPPNVSGDGLAGGDFVVRFATDPAIAALTIPVSTLLTPAFVTDMAGAVFAGVISSPTDVDGIYLDLAANQKLSFTVAPASTTLRFAVDVLDGAGSIIASGEGPELGTRVDLRGIPITATGRYAIRVRCIQGVGGFTVRDLQLNLISELEPKTGTPNNTLASAESLESSRLDLAPGITRWAASGIVGFSTQPLDASDWYAVDLPANSTLSAVASPGTARLSIVDSFGAKIAYFAQTSAADGTFGIAELPIAQAGRYYVRAEVSTPVTTGAYTFSVMSNAKFDNAARMTPADPLGAHAGALGYVVGGAGATSDVYSIYANAGDTLLLETRTPGTRTSGSSMLNLLTPRVELRDATGATLLASNSGGAADGVNARLSYPVTTSGYYRVTVSAVGTSGGYYVLTVAGDAAAPTTPAFQLVSSSPAANGGTAKPFDRVRLQLSQAIDLRTVEASDLTVNGVPATSFSAIDGRTLEFLVSVPQVDSTAAMSVAQGAFADLRGTPVDAITFSAFVDITGPKVVAPSVQRGDKLAEGNVTVTFDFDRPLLAAGLSTSDVTLQGVLTGLRTASSIAYDPGSYRVTVQFANLRDDLYTLTLLSGDNAFEGAGGVDMDGEAINWPMPPNRSGDGTPGGHFVVQFEVDGDSFPITSVTPVGLTGAIGFEASNSRYIWREGDIEEATLDLDANQMASFFVDVQSPDVLVRADVLNAAGIVVATATSPALGADVLVDAAPIAQAGVYRFRVTALNSVGGRIALNPRLNVAREREPIFAAPNNDVLAAQSLSLNRLSLASGAGRYAVSGTIATTSDVDFYAVDLTQGDVLNAYLNTSSFAIALFDPSGQRVANSYTSGVSLIHEAVAGVTGTYFLRVAPIGATNGAYELLLLDDLFFDPTITTISTPGTGSVGGLGQLAGTTVDSYFVYASAGDVLRIETSTPGGGAGLFVNDLNPAIQLLAPNGAVIAAADNNAGDLRNAFISEPIATAGTYRVNVLKSPQLTAAVDGAYVVRITGATGVRPAFSVSATSVTSGSTVTTQGAPYTVTFNRRVDLSTLQASDVSFNGVPATALTNVTDTSASFTIPVALEDGPVAVAIAAGSVRDLQQTPLTAFTSNFTLNAAPVRIVSANVYNGAVLTYSSSGTVLNFMFSRDVVSANFDATDFVLTRAIGVPATFTPTIAYAASTRTLTLTFALADNNYTLRILSGAGRVQDTSGRDLDGEAPAGPMPPGRSGNGVAGGDFVIEFAVDNPGATALTVSADSLRGAFSSSLSGSSIDSERLVYSTDVEFATIAIQAGQTITAVADVDPTSPIRPLVEIVDAANVVRASNASTAPGVDAVAMTGELGAGTYTVRISAANGAIGAYTLIGRLNGDVDRGQYGGVAHASLATAQPLDRARARVPGGPYRSLVIGSLTDGADDWYSFNLDAGTTMSLALRGGTALLPMEIYDPSGQPVEAPAESGENYKWRQSFRAEATGRYAVRLPASAAAYALVAIENGRIETEFNGRPAAAEPLIPGLAALGGTALVAPIATRMNAIQDTAPWGSIVVSQMWSSLYSATASTSIATSPFINMLFLPTSMQVAMITGNQSSTTYATVAAEMGRLERFVDRGNVLVVSHASSSGNSAGFDLLPGAPGTTYVPFAGSNVDVAAPGHPSLGSVDVNSFDGFTNLYLGYFPLHTLPPGATPILTTEDPSRVVMFEYTYGAGKVIVFGMPIEQLATGGVGPTGGSQLLNNVFNYTKTSVVPQEDDVYSMSMSAGNRYTVTANLPWRETGHPNIGGRLTLRIEDAAGTVLAQSDSALGDIDPRVVSFEPAASGTYYVRLRATLGQINEYVLSASVASPPAILSAQVRTSDQRAFTLTFDQPIDPLSIEASDLVVERTEDGSEHLADGVDVAADGLTATWTYGRALPDGSYSLRLASGSVRSILQMPLAADVSIDGPQLFVLAGDVNHDRVVSFDDLLVLAARYNAAATRGFLDGDFDLNGTVDFDDLLILAANYNRSA